MIDDQPIEKHYIPQQSFGYQSVVIIMVILFLATLLQITIINRTGKIETNLTNMRNACFVITEKEKP